MGRTFFLVAEFRAGLAGKIRQELATLLDEWNVCWEDILKS